MIKKLREGFTTGAASAGAIKAALNALLLKKAPSFVEILAPAGNLNIPVARYVLSDRYASAVVIKDGGDDPDSTHNIEIVAEVFTDEYFKNTSILSKLKLSEDFDFYASKGIGIVTRKGLPVTPGEPAINPVPRKIIKQNAEKIISGLKIKDKISIVLSVPRGEEIAKKTLNERLGIIGGISILGTTGIVKPVSMDAFKESIKMALMVAREADTEKIVLSFGRQSEEAVEKILHLGRESFVIMGDHFDYALKEAKKIGFKKIFIAGQLGKILKALLGYKNTNVKYGEFNIDQVITFFKNSGIAKNDLNTLKTAHTARHLMEIIEREEMDYILDRLVIKFKEMFKTEVFLVSYDGKVIRKA